jgi:hypothetical protein
VKDVSRTDCRIRGRQIWIVAVFLHGRDAYLEKFFILLEQLKEMRQDVYWRTCRPFDLFFWDEIS